jgi:hypothetical protein
VTKGAHGFRKYVLPSLKYYNPGLEIDVQCFPRATSLLTLHFQCQDQQKLRNLAQPGKEFLKKLPESTSPEAPDYRKAGAPRPSAAHDDVKPRQIPAGSDLPQPLYQRSVTLSLRERPTWNVLQWFRSRTKAEKIELTPEDEKLMQQLAEEEVRKDEQKEKNKIHQAALDREKEVLKQAQKIAEQNATEANLQV